MHSPRIPRRRRHTARAARAALVLAAAVLVLGGCSDGDDDPPTTTAAAVQPETDADGSAAGTGSTTTDGTDPTSSSTSDPSTPPDDDGEGDGDPAEPGVAAFCARYNELNDQAVGPDVGVDEYVAYLEELIDLAPDEVRGDIEVMRDFIADSGFDPNDPETMPDDGIAPEVERAIDDATAYTDQHC